MRVGGDVESICGKCGDTWHVVIARAAGSIAKVECNECGARHRYRPLKGSTAAAPRARRSTSGVRSSRARTLSKTPVVEADLSRPPRPFRTTETYRAGDRLVHPSFGQGVVQAVMGPTKIQVSFDGEPKTLVHGRGG